MPPDRLSVPRRATASRALTDLLVAFASPLWRPPVPLRLLLLLAIPAVVVGCSEPEGAAESAKARSLQAGRPPAVPMPAPPPTPKGQIRLAAIFPASGRYAGSGRESMRGVELAVERLNQAGGVGGRRLFLAAHRTRSDVETTQEAAEEAVAAGAVAIVGSNASLLSDTIARVAERAGIVMVSNVSTATRLTHGRPFVFRTCYSNDRVAQLLARFCRDRLRLSRVAILQEVSRPYSDDLGNSFARHFRAAAGDDAVRTWRYATMDPDLTPQLDEIAAFGPDALFLPSSYDDATLVAIHLRRLGRKLVMIGGDSWTNDRLFARGRLLNEAYHSDHWCPKAGNAFVERYTARFRAKPQGGRAALAFDAVFTIARALERAAESTGGTLRTEDLAGPGLAQFRRTLRDRLGAVKYDGVTGHIEFDREGDAKKPCFVFRVDKNGRSPFATIR